MGVCFLYGSSNMCSFSYIDNGSLSLVQKEHSIFQRYLDFEREKLNLID